MNLLPFLLDIIKYTIAGMGVVWIAFYLIKPYLDRDEKIQLLEFRKAISGQTLPLRLQAYERLVYTAAELHALVVEDIRSEYQHNITQQIYVSSRAWSVIKHIKDDTFNIINNAYRSLPENASGLDMGKTILTYISELEDNPYELGSIALRKDLEELF
jgi:hypothetical protein